MSTAHITSQDVERHENGEFNWIKAAKTRYTENYKGVLAKRRELPVFRQRQEFLEKYQKSRVVVLTSETGSGKTTEIPPLVYFNDRSQFLQVICTQPRRTVATSVAARVAEVMDVKLGEEVGYRVRFDDRTGPKTKIVYATDGTLLKESENDQLFSKYSCVIVDEAHERNINSDLLMGMLKYALTKRTNLHVIIMSATLDASKFQEYFSGADFLHIKGRTRPVTINYLAEATPNFFNLALSTVMWIHKKHDQDRDNPGHILVFFPGEDEIQRGCQMLREDLPELQVLPFYSSLPRDEQNKVYLPAGKGQRKCVLSTNIAEAGVTIPDIAYVIDTGLVKHVSYNPRLGVEVFKTAAISKAAAQQRAGRAGRTRDGKCFRLYTKDTFDHIFTPTTLPEMMRCNMNSLVLRVKGIGWDNVLTWPFIDPPAPELLFRALEELYDMGLIDEAGSLTPKGKQAKTLSVDPAWFVAIDEGHRLGCSSDMLTLAAIFGIQNSIFARPWALQAVAAQAKTFFSSPVSEHMAYINAMHAYVREKIAGRVDMDQWCQEHFLSRRAIEEALVLRDQLVRQWEGLINGQINSELASSDKYETNIRKALARGFSHHAAILHNGRYVMVHKNQVALLSEHSPLLGLNYEWIIYDKCVLTGKQRFMVTTAVDPEWLMDLPAFQPARWAKDYSGSIKQRYAKESLDAARALTTSPAQADNNHPSPEQSLNTTSPAQADHNHPSPNTNYPSPARTNFTTGFRRKPTTTTVSGESQHGTYTTSPAQAETERSLSGA